MEHYVLGETRDVEDEDPAQLTTDPNAVHMRVKDGSKIRNLMGYAMKKIKVNHHIHFQISVADKTSKSVEWPNCCYCTSLIPYPRCAQVQKPCHFYFVPSVL